MWGSIAEARDTALAYQPPDELGLIVLGYIALAIAALVWLVRHG